MAEMSQHSSEIAFAQGMAELHRRYGNRIGQEGVKPLDLLLELHNEVQRLMRRHGVPLLLY